MRTAGEILKEARNKKSISLEQAEKDTKIRKRVLSLIEEGNWSSLTPTYLKGLLKNYAAYLGIDPGQILAFFRREFDEKKAPASSTPAKRKRPIRFTPAGTTALLVLSFIAVVIGYLYLQYRSFTGAPLLEIAQPEDNAQLTSPEVNVIGSTTTDAIVKINGEQIQISPGGAFSVAVALKEGMNNITVTATNRFGKITTVTRTVIVELPEKTGGNGESQDLTLRLEITNKSTSLQVEVDGAPTFNGLMIAGSVRQFSAKQKIKIITENGGATKVTVNGQEFVLGKEGERVEREFTH